MSYDHYYKNQRFTLRKDNLYEAVEPEEIDVKKWAVDDANAGQVLLVEKKGEKYYPYLISIEEATFDSALGIGCRTPGLFVFAAVAARQCNTIGGIG